MKLVCEIERYPFYLVVEVNSKITIEVGKEIRIPQSKVRQEYIEFDSENRYQLLTVVGDGACETRAPDGNWWAFGKGVIIQKKLVERAELLIYQKLNY